MGSEELPFAGLIPTNRTRPGLTLKEIARIEALFGVQLPTEYRDFLQWGDGWEGWLGDDYLILVGSDDLPSANDREFRSAFPGLVAIGGNGGLETYALDYRDGFGSPGVVAVDRNSADDRDIRPLAIGFLDALDVIRAGT